MEISTKTSNNRWDNIVALFGNAKTRTILLTTLGILIFGVVISLVGLHLHSKSNIPSGAETSDLPSIQSIPAISQQTPAYHQALQQSNQIQAQQAEKTGASAVATYTGTLKNDQQTNTGYNQYGLPTSLNNGANTQYGPNGQPLNPNGEQLGPNGQPLLGPNGLPMNANGQEIGPNGELVGPNGQLLLGPNGLPMNAKGQEIGSNGQLVGPNGQPLLGPHGLPMNANGQEIGPNGELIGSNGQPILGPNGLPLNANGQEIGPNGQLISPKSAASNQAANDESNPDEAKFHQFQKQLAQQELASVEQLASQEVQNAPQNEKAAQTAMANQSKALLSDWTVPVQSFVQGNPPPPKSAAEAAAAAAQKAPVNPDDVIKAGDIKYAILETAVNTDEPGPVLATIIQGKYKGAKLIGAVQPVSSEYSEKVVLTFNTMSIPGQTDSFQINAVAVDPDTSRTALATSVNHHYLSRYGLLLASSFLEGYGSAVGSSGSSTYYNPLGGAFTVFNQKTTGEQIAMAFGQVGQTVGEQLGNYFNRPPTIKVESGLGIGILYLADVNTEQGEQPNS